MRALSIRQPYAEEILQGIKTIEYRPNPTKKIGERFFIYAAKQYPKPADLKKFCKRYRTMKLIKEAEAANRGGEGAMRAVRGACRAASSSASQRSHTSRLQPRRCRITIGT